MIDKRYWSMLIGFFICLTIWRHLYKDEVKTPPLIFTINSANTTATSFAYPKLPPDDYDRLVDKDDFQFLLMSDCYDQDEKRSSPLLLLVLVHTSPTHSDKRNTIRETWGQKRDIVRVVFMIGSVNNVTIMDDIRNENEKYRDLVQGNFMDSYRNMTYKHAMVFKYVIYHCPDAKYILKTDDDVFVNMPRFIDFLNYDLSPTGISNLLFCTPYENARARRSFRSKWRVTYDEYPEKYYPNYCPGWSLLYSPDILYALYVKIQRHKYFWIDDVLITGILSKELHIEHTIFDFLTLDKDVQNGIVNGTIFKYNEDEYNNNFLYGTPDIEENVIRGLWNYVDKISQNRSVLVNYNF